MPISFRKDTFAKVIFPRKHNKALKNLITSLLLSVFLFSNYVVNFTHHHHDEIFNTDIAKGKEEPHGCLVCHFQNLVYEPLVQKDFGIKDFFIETENINYPEFVSFVILEHFYAIHQRGPPSFLG